MDHSQPASMQDVAKAASVSPQTVSRVANGSNAVRPETRQRVEAAMAKLGYRPNYAARALKHGKFKDVGVVLFNMLTYGNARILGGIADAANSNGYAITMQSFGRNRERTLHAAIERMKQLPVDGVIAVMEEHVTDFSEFRPPKELPVVIISEDPANYCPTIDADQYGCSAAVVDYLLSKGHKTVYHIAGPSSSRAAESRAQGWHDTLDQLGLRIPPTYMGDWEADSGYQAGLALAHDPDCTAIYAANDQMAYGAMLGLQAAGKRVPEDVSIVGVDDSLSGTIPRLSLTTMRMKFNDIGREAFFMTKRLCEGLRVPSGVKTVVPAELVERGSVRDLESSDDESQAIMASASPVSNGRGRGHYPFSAGDSSEVRRLHNALRSPMRYIRSMPSAVRVGSRRTPSVFAPMALHMLAECEPMSTVPTTSTVEPRTLSARPTSCHRRSPC